LNWGGTGSGWHTPQANNQQHDALQSQEGDLPDSIPLMIAAAQPTPLTTDSAPGAQFSAQAPHSMQDARSTIAARFLTMENTA